MKKCVNSVSVVLSWFHQLKITMYAYPYISSSLCNIEEILKISPMDTHLNIPMFWELLLLANKRYRLKLTKVFHTI